MAVLQCVHSASIMQYNPPEEKRWLFNKGVAFRICKCKQAKTLIE